MFHHVVLLKFRDSATAEDRERVTATIAGLNNSAPGISSLKVSMNVGDHRDNFDLIVQVDAVDPAGWEAYHASAQHDDVDEKITPFIENRAAIQFADPA